MIAGTIIALILIIAFYQFLLGFIIGVIGSEMTEKKGEKNKWE